jgi:quinol-cytochrome oxidoreductase complex cytochrome b subunit
VGAGVEQDGMVAEQEGVAPEQGQGWLEERLGLRWVARHVLDRPVPVGVTWFHCFGGLTFFTFLVLVVTGIVLAFYYVPSPDHARASVAWIDSSLPFGSLVRNLHRWSAYAMIVLVFLHMVRVFVHGAYRKPRELSWVVGVLMLLAVLALGFTGYLLPWDQKGYWATNVGINIAGSVPLVGPYLADLLRGGQELGALTLLRFYALHVFVLPLLVGGGLVAHFAMIRKQGISKPL